MPTESRGRLERLIASRPGMAAAAAKATAEGRIDPKRFGLTQKQVEDAAQARASQLESVGMTTDQLAGYEAIVRVTGRPPLLVRNNAVELQPLDDFPTGTDARIKAAEAFIPSVGRVDFINHSMSWGGTGWDSARTHGFKATVFTAPVFGDEDPVLEEENVRVPLEFWKVVAMIDSSKDKLHATAYLLSQGQLIRKLLEDRDRSEAVEGFVLGPYRTFQISISDLERAVEYDFGALRDADPLARTRRGREAAAADVPIVVPIESSGDLVL